MDRKRSVRRGFICATKDIAGSGGTGNDAIVVNNITDDQFDDGLNANLATYVNGGGGNDSIASNMSDFRAFANSTLLNRLAGGDGNDTIIANNLQAASYGGATLTINVDPGDRQLSALHGTASCLQRA